MSQALQNLHEQGLAPDIPEADLLYQIRNLQSFNNGESFQGVFAKIRTSDIPHIGNTDGDEREIDLADDEGVIEKNHFLYYRANELLVYQSNGNGSTVEAFSRYLSTILNHTTTFNAVLRADPMRRMMNGNLEPRSIELSVARPTNPELYPEDNWSNDLFRLMAGVDGYKAHITITAEGTGRGATGRLLDRAKRAAAILVNNGNANIARIKMAGIDQPIDLIADRILAEVSVEMQGRYPVPQAMYRALMQARDNARQELEDFFGHQNVLG